MSECWGDDANGVTQNVRLEGGREKEKISKLKEEELVEDSAMREPGVMCRLLLADIACRLHLEAPPEPRRPRPVIVSFKKKFILERRRASFGPGRKRNTRECV